MWNRTVLTIAAVLLAGTPVAVHVVKAAPEAARSPLAPGLQKSADTRFKPTCRGDEILDSRPDPAWVHASFNRDRCQEPPLPAPLDGHSASREAVVAAMAAAQRYAGAADRFQKCVSDFVAARRAEVSHGGIALTPSQIIIENHRLLASQRAKETAQAQVRIAITAFNEYGSECPDHG
jgi:hypothetical protein